MAAGWEGRSAFDSLTAVEQREVLPSRQASPVACADVGAAAARREQCGDVARLDLGATGISVDFVEAREQNRRAGVEASMTLRGAPLAPEPCAVVDVER